MRTRTLWVLAAVVAALVAFIWFIERDLPSSDERAEAAKKVLGLELDEVTALTIERGEAPRVRVERQPAAAPADAVDSDESWEESEWRLTAPLEARADGAKVRGLVRQLVELDKERTLEDPDLEASGLASPRARVTLETAAGATTLLVGASLPASATLLAAVEGRTGRAFVVDDAFLDDLERDPGELRSRELFTGSRDQIERVRLAGAAGAVVLERRDAGFWLVEPLEDRADKDLVSSLLGALVALRAERFLGPPRPPEAELGLETPATLELELDGGERLLVELGAPAGDNRRYARVGGETVEIGGSLDEALERSPEAWRATAWTSFDSWETDEIVVRDGEGELGLVRRDGDWQRDGEKIAYTPVSELLYALSGIEAERLLPAPSEMAGEPSLEIELKGAERAETLRLYRSAGGVGGPIATVSGRAVRLVLAPAAVEELEVKVEEVRAAPVLEPVNDDEAAA